MKVVILCGGMGTRMAEETELRPKPMVEIGGRPILWHIMKHYAGHGFNEFFLALGYKGEHIKRFFVDYYTLNRNITVDLSTGNVKRYETENENWIVHLMDTGHDTMTGGRLKRLEPWLRNEPFMLTYGDGLSNVDLSDLEKFHRRNGRIATITAVRPPSRFGGLVFSGNLVSKFTEKPETGEGWINGGFMVLQPEVFKHLKDDRSVLEVDAIQRLGAKRQLAARRHDGFWQCMDTLRDKRVLDKLWDSGKAPWKTWA
ncbi:MAG: glucose-1-phosphate cytidylyltransferase [bacterium]